MTDTEVLAMRKKKVIKSNELIQKSKFNLSAQQQKVILYLIAQLNKEDEDFVEYEFNITDYCQVCGIDARNGTIREELKKQIKAIADKSMWYYDGKRETLMRWIEKPTIDYEENKIKIRFDKDMKPFLLKLKDNYTCFELMYALHFKRKYSIRLFELIKSVHYNKEEIYSYIFEVDKLKVLLGAENYNTFSNFNRCVLKPSIEEINKYSDMTLQAIQKKEGKTVRRIEIIITPKDKIDKQLLEFHTQMEMGLPK